MSLDDIGRKYGTGKSSEFHGFLDYYELTIRDKQIESVLEIGVGSNAQSLRMWAEFLPQATIYGFDINEGYLLNEGRIRTFLCDQSNPDAIRRAMSENKIDPDLFIDDGSHIWSHQMITYNTVYPLLKKGAVYIVEDLHTSVYYGKCWKDQEQNPLEFFSGLLNFSIIKTKVDAEHLPIRGITGIGIKV